MTIKWRLTRTVYFIKLALMTKTFVTACLTGGTGAYTDFQFTVFQVYRTRFKHKRRYLKCLKQKRGTETIDILLRARAVIPQTPPRVNTRSQQRKKNIYTGQTSQNGLFPVKSRYLLMSSRRPAVFCVRGVVLQRVLDPTLAPLPRPGLGWYWSDCAVFRKLPTRLPEPT